MAHRRVRRGPASALLALFLAGCAAPEVAGLPGAAPAVLDRLYFGRSIAGGGQVTDVEWRAFVDEVITPRFPAGATIYDAYGQWRGEDGELVREPSFVLEVLHSGGVREDAALDEIAAEYRRRFRQEAVLHVRSRIDYSVLD